MINWIMLLTACVLIALILLKSAAAAQRVWSLVGATLMIGLAGYAWQGQPALDSKSAAKRTDVRAASPATPRGFSASGSFSTDGEYLGYADAMMRIGQTQTAVSLLSGGVAKYPSNADLWVGLANALIVHGNGLVSPAAQFAVQKARSLSPNNFGAAFLAGLSAAQGERLDEARAIWSDMLERSPPAAPWRADLEQRIKAIDVAQSPQLQQR